MTTQCQASSSESETVASVLPAASGSASGPTSPQNGQPSSSPGESLARIAEALVNVAETQNAILTMQARILAKLVELGADMTLEGDDDDGEYTLDGRRVR